MTQEKKSFWDKLALANNSCCSPKPQKQEEKEKQIKEEKESQEKKKNVNQSPTNCCG